jgi:cytochrome c5
MVNNAIKGKGIMPARGGNPTLDDLEIARAVVYMTNAAGANFAEPVAAEAAAAAAPAPAPAPMAVAAVTPPPAAPAPAAVVAAAPAAASINLAAGEALYKQACAACHSIGIAGAPKFGDKVAWAKATATGMESMIASVIKGKGIMPARGGVANASDADIAAAVHYMVNALQ